MGPFYDSISFMEDEQDVQIRENFSSVRWTPSAEIWVKSYCQIGEEESIVWFPSAQEKGKQTDHNVMISGN